ncbi:MAG: type VI secretion system-associated protein TagF [Gammaproteobacteria bacterium]|nr:type VI secretion system-associated protein TagF [Gammaproteobacteria bacterium]MDH5802699.1 type VI secretion system-associated protein TagF [Gammaproteobacteria bacterium]
MSTATSGPGFYGKIPSNGDFLNRRTPREFLEPWDAWLQKSIARSKEQLSDQWLDTYLTSPIWRFVLGPSICGNQAYAGVLMPSVDKVGRYFPLTILVPIPNGFNILQLPKDMNDWFDAAEQQALNALDEPFDLDAFDKAVEQLDVPVSISATAYSTATTNTVSVHSSGKSTFQALATNQEMIGPYLNLLNHFLFCFNKHYSVWWTSGSPKVKPCFLTSQGLPPVEGYSGFLDGRWPLWGWHESENTKVVTQSNAQGGIIPEDWNL